MTTLMEDHSYSMPHPLLEHNYYRSLDNIKYQKIEDHIISYKHLSLDHTYSKRISKISGAKISGEDNLQLDKLKLEEIYKHIEKLRAVCPRSVCSMCGKILYPSAETLDRKSASKSTKSMKIYSS